MSEKGVLISRIEPTVMWEYDDGKFNTLVIGFTPNTRVDLPAGYTHFGVVAEGKIELSYYTRDRELVKGDFFSVIGPATIRSTGMGLVSSARGYTGFNLFGGPLEGKGKLRYIDGCTDTLLVPPVRKGDPCLNHLHFPTGITQTPHTHPSVRTGVIYKGFGVCLVPEEKKSIPLVSGHAFLLKNETIHSFNTGSESMDVVAFHPDTDTGMTDEDHPMVNRTIVDGVSASQRPDIRTT